jgi:hypothetical protein
VWSAVALYPGDDDVAGFGEEVGEGGHSRTVALRLTIKVIAVDQ